MPGPAQFGGQPVTNIRNVPSPHWRGWLSASSRCLVPATSFCEYEDTKPRKTPDVVRAERGPTFVRLRRIVDALARRARAEGRAGRASMNYSGS
jgi:hypothetical protein